jgi:hypothetical protein
MPRTTIDFHTSLVAQEVLYVVIYFFKELRP